MKMPREGTPVGCLPGAFFCAEFFHGAAILEGVLGKRLQCWLAMVFSVALCAQVAPAQGSQTENLNSEFQSAAAAYDAGHYAQAAAQLEQLLPRVPDSFEVNELLGQAYASLSQDAKAIEHLEAAVRLKPDSAPARENLAASLAHSGKTQLAEEQFRKALALEPQDFDANHNLGEFYAQSGKLVTRFPFSNGRRGSILPPTTMATTWR